MAKLIGDVKAGAPLLRTLLHNAARDVPGEQVATLLQDANEWAVLNPDKPFSDYLAARPAAAAQTLIATLVGTGGNVAVTHGLQRAADRVTGEQRAAQWAEQQAQALADVVKLAEASKVRERDPQAFAEFAQSLVDDGVPHLYVDARTLAQATDIAAVAQVLPSVAEQIEQAAATGGDVVIPTQEFLAAATGQTFTQALIEHARTAAEAMSPAQAREFLASPAGQRVQTEFEQALQQQEQDQTWQQLRDEIRDGFRAQLDETRRFTADVNAQYATLLANFYSVTAARLGIAPRELVDRYGLQVRRDDATAGRRLDQAGALDDVRQQWAAQGIDGSITESGDRITLGKIVVPQDARGAGKGTAAMRALLDYADRAGKSIVLSPSADFGGNKARLTQFYKRLGFVENKGRNRAFTVSEAMYRPAPGKVLFQDARSASTFEEARKAAKAFQGKPLVNEETGLQATVSRNTLDKMLSGKAVGKSESPAAHAHAVANLDALFARAIHGWAKPDQAGDPNIAAIHRFFTTMSHDGRDLMVKMTVKETRIQADPNPLYTVEAVEINEKSPAAQWVAATLAADGVEPTSIRSAGDVLNLAKSVQARNAGTQFYQGRKRDDYTLDLFGVPEDGGAGAPAAEPAGGRQPGTVFRDDAPGRFATRTELVEENTRTLGTDRVTTPQEAAQALAYLHKSAVERFDALVTDKDGKPLAVVGAFKGALAQTSVYPATVAAEAFRIEGAANIWFAHNHPSGNAALSKADGVLNATLAEVFRGSQIQPRGLFAIGGAAESGGRRWQYDPGVQGGVLQDGATEKPGKGSSVPVVERVLSEETKLGPPITGPSAAKAAARSIAGGESGALLLDSQNTPIAFVTVPADMTNQLRTEGRMDALWRALSMANAGAAIIVNHGDYDIAQAENLAGFFNAAAARVLDIMDVSDSSVTSWAEKGLGFSDPTFFQSSTAPHTGDTIEVDGTVRPALNSAGQPIHPTQEGLRNFWRWFGDSKVVDEQGRPLVVYHGTDTEITAFDGRKTADGAFWFTADAQTLATGEAGAAASGFVIPAYLRAEKLAGWDEYDDLTTDQLLAEGFDGVQLDADYIVFLPEQIKSATGNDGSFDAADTSILSQEARGSISLPEDWARSPAVISLFKGADLSTFIHESGHFFLEVQMDLAARIYAAVRSGEVVSDGEREILADARRILDWFGIKGAEGVDPLTEWHGLELEAKRPYHEQWARGFEAYAFEGKAPSLELHGMFQRFRAWLLAVYRELKALNVELTDDVRGVMDRMLASTQAIQEAEAARRMGPLFKTADDAGMTPQEFLAYHALATEASQAAIDQLQARGLRDMRWLANARDRKLRELQKAVAAMRREVEREVRAEVMSQPVYRAWQFLTGKGDAQDTAQPDAKPKASKSLDAVNDSLFTAIAKLGGLDKEDAIRLWDLDPKERLDSGVFGMPVWRKAGGLTVKQMAARLTEEGYLLPDTEGRHDVGAFFDAFDRERRGEPVYSLWHEYQRPDDGAPAQPLPEHVAYGKLDTDALKAQYGAAPNAVWRRLQDRRMTSASRGIHPDVVAETFGFSSGDELVRALADAEPPASVIEGMTDQRMLERHGDLGTPEGLQRAADQAIHNDARARFVAAEVTALATGMRVREDTGRRDARGRPVTGDLLARVAREAAQRIVGATKVRDLRPGQYTAAEVRAARAAERAMQAGRTEDALAEKRHQLLNLQAAKAAYAAQDEVSRTLDYLRRFDKRPAGLDADYAEQIEALLDRFDLRRATTGKAIERRKSLVEWVESQREQGMEPDIPPDLLNEAMRRSYKDMTVDELRGLRDSIKQIEHLGRLKNRLLTAKAAREFAAVRDEIADSIAANADGRTADTRTPATVLGRSLRAVKDFGAAHIKAATWARIFDGGKDGGPVWEYLIRTANDRADMEAGMRAQATQQLHDILEPWLKAGKNGGKGQFFASVNRALNREQILAMALNMGNEGNLQRMLGGENWTLQQIKPVLDTLTAADWRTVQAVWDHFEGYRPQIAALERRTHGKEPNWVAPMPFDVHTADGQVVSLRGGYYPIKYDPLASSRAEQHAEAEDAKRQLQGAYMVAQTRRSFTKPRADEVIGRPLLYSLAGVYSGVNDMIHDLSWREWLMDANKILRSDKIDSAIRQHYGPAAVKQLKTWVQDVTAGERGAQDAVEQVLSHLRQGISAAGLGFNVMSALLQPLGLTQSIVRVGGKWVGRGVMQFLGAPRGKAREVNTKSEFMANRTRTRFRELNELRNQVEGQT
ncbi:MAG: hypothetical protein MK041_03210, partial [Aquabacterium sp.]|nr:hypothetical protein [Aquabacterium sp.]